VLWHALEAEVAHNIVQQVHKHGHFLSRVYMEFLCAVQNVEQLLSNFLVFFKLQTWCSNCVNFVSIFCLLMFSECHLMHC
jgi:hypothetical protein